MSRLPVPILAYHIASRKAYLFPGQTEAARWLQAKGICHGTLNTIRSNLCLVSTWPRPDSGIARRALHGFIWVRGEGPETIGPVLMDKLLHRLRIWALIDAPWNRATDADLVRAMNAAGITDPAHEVTLDPLSLGCSAPVLEEGLPSVDDPAYSDGRDFEV